MSRICSQCNEPNAPEAAFCIFCGTAFPKAVDDAGKPASQAAPSGFQFKWMLLGALFMIVGIVAVSLILGFVAAILGLDFDEADETVILVLGSIAFILGLFGGSALTGYRSPGVTVREPVVAIILVIVLMNLVTGNVAGIFVGWVIPALLAFGGARLGERLQRRRGR
jgi:hypothetical protein